MILNRYFSPGDGGGDPAGDGGDGGDGGGESHWTAEHAYFQDNPEAAKGFQKYKTADDAFKGAHELMQQAGKPYKLPKDLAKLSEEQKAEWQAGLRKLHGVPDAPEGYEFEIPEGATIDDDTMVEYRKLAHERGIDPQTAKDLLGLQLGMVQRLNAKREKVIQGMTDNNYKTFLNEDCQGDKDLAATRLEQVKQFLQKQFTKDGQIDTAGWEKFATRVYHGDRIIELPLLRALHAAAQQTMGTGGAPAGYGETTRPAGRQPYAEMKRK